MLNAERLTLIAADGRKAESIKHKVEISSVRRLALSVEHNKKIIS
ncbi:hypothetical protein SAMN04488505_111258 [Chitinophaga rupis]|uniref:Uncharacterized protein n=1 Tax=Chitinophaga rupis TaxID=573321 RepID=A0A1H8I769_9BACT|nr:hypothetical protein SAMN04488505_111258 [Chitinophaga rupis]